MHNYSNKDFTGHDLSSRKDMSGITIENSCFSNEMPNAMIFPDEMIGTTFVDCNLDNCFIPPGNDIVRGTHRYFQVQNDGEDWIVDPKTLEPLEPINLKLFQIHKLSNDPADIPAKPADKSVILRKIEAVALQKSAEIQAIEERVE